MALDAADLAGRAQPPRVVLVDKRLEHAPAVADALGVLVTYTDVDAGGALGEEPPVARRHQAIEDHLDMVRAAGDALPPAHDRLHRARRPRIQPEPGVGAVGDDRDARVDLAAVPADDARDALALRAEPLHREARNELHAGRARTLEQRVIERAPQAHDRGGRLAAGHHQLAVTGRHQTQPGDAIGVRLDRVPHIELAQRADTARRQAAAARLVAREVGAVQEHHIAHAELAQAQRRRRSRGTGPDDRDGRAPHDRSPRSAPPAWRSVASDNPSATRVRATTGRPSAPSRRRPGTAWPTTCAYSRAMIVMRPSCVDSSAIDAARPRGLHFQ